MTSLLFSVQRLVINLITARVKEHLGAYVIYNVRVGNAFPCFIIFKSMIGLPEIIENLNIVRQEYLKVKT